VGRKWDATWEEDKTFRALQVICQVQNNTSGRAGRMRKGGAVLSTGLHTHCTLGGTAWRL
jgi:hypothetical protein